jgi:hypothetical protein
MSGFEGIIVAALFAISVIIVFGLSIHIAWRHRKADLPTSTQFNDSFNTAKWYKKLNFGALLFSPFWLFSNGFWISTLLYCLITIQWPLLGLVVSIFLFFRGSSWSWGTGSRWGYDSEAFMDEQVFWSSLCWYFLISIITITTLSFFT